MRRSAEDGIGSGVTFSSALDHVLSVVRRNPVLVMLIAAGVGWLAARMQSVRMSASRNEQDAQAIPVLNTGQTRLYDPDVSPLHPAQDPREGLRDIGPSLVTERRRREEMWR
jgi:hypothetical protein